MKTERGAMSKRSAHFGLASFALWLFGTGTAPAPAPVCQPSAPKVEIAAEFHDYELDHGKPRREMARMLSKPIPFEGFAMQGMTTVSFGTSYRLSVSLSDDGKGAWCAQVDAVEGKFGVAEPAKVMLANEIEEGSCQFRTVFDHERRHVDIARRASESGAKDMQAAILEALRRPLAAGSKDGAYSAAKEAVDKAASAASRKAVSWADSENAAMDTYESYERLRMQCP